MTDNPFEASGVAPPPGEVALFTPVHVSVATLVGSPFAGATLLWMNARRLDRPVGPVVAWTAGLIAVLTVAGMILPDSVPEVVYTIAAVFGMRAVAEQLYAEALATHPRAGWGLALAVAFGWLAAIVAVAAVVVTAILFDG